MKTFLLVFFVLLVCITTSSEKSQRSTKGPTRASDYELSRQMSLLRAATTTRINEELSPGNVTAIHGENAMLVCTIQNIGDKSVSWLRHSTPIPDLLAVNNITNTLNPRYKAVVSGHWTEFLLIITDVRPRDAGVYECQVSGPKHSSLNKFITLTVIESITEIVGGPEIHVDCHSTLQLTCLVQSGDKTPAYIIWQRDNKILKFDGGETSAVKYLSRDSSGNHVSNLVIEDIQMGDSGEYTCQPAAGAAARVLVHVLQRETEVQAVLGEGGEENIPAVVTLPPPQASSPADVQAPNFVATMSSMLLVTSAKYLSLCNYY